MYVHQLPRMEEVDAEDEFTWKVRLVNKHNDETVARMSNVERGCHSCRPDLFMYPVATKHLRHITASSYVGIQYNVLVENLRCHNPVLEAECGTDGALKVIALDDNGAIFPCGLCNSNLAECIHMRHVEVAAVPRVQGVWEQFILN